MAVEIISWPNLYERYLAGPEDRTRDHLNTSQTAHPTDIVGPTVTVTIVQVLAFIKAWSWSIRISFFYILLPDVHL